MELKPKKVVKVVLAATEEGGIGLEGSIPWRLKGDMLHFKNLTTETWEKGENVKNAVIMGRKTWDSIPAKFRPLAGRVNVVITSHDLENEDVLCYRSLEEAVEALNNYTRVKIGDIFVIGGARLYEEALSLPSSSPAACQFLHLTRVLTPFHCDTHVDAKLLPPAGFEQFTIPSEREEVMADGKVVKYEICLYERL